jgi:hypothetical protein
MGRNRKKHPELPTVPLCWKCHAREDDEETINELIQKAPGYWMSTGQWELAYPLYARFLGRREFIEAVK